MNTIIRANLIFGITLLVGLTLLSQMVLLVAHLIWDVQAPGIFLQYCISAFSEGTILHNAIMLFFIGIFVYTIGRILWRIVRQISTTYKSVASINKNKHDKQSNLLNKKYRNWNTEIIVIQDENFIAMSLGLFRPRIIVSTTVINMFSDHELKSILLHEWYHCRNRDTLKILFLTLILEGMGYIPTLKALVRDYKTCTELLADRFAMTQMGTEYYLGNVLFKIIRIGNMERSTVGAHFGDHAINYRIKQVLEPEMQFQIPTPFFKPMLSTVIVIFFISGIVLGGCS